MGMRIGFLAMALLLAPTLGWAEEPRVLEGQFRLNFAQRNCVRPPCPPGNWVILQDEARFHATRLVIDPATPAPVQAAIARASSGFNPSAVEGRIRIEDGVATILARRFTPISRR